MFWAEVSGIDTKKQENKVLHTSEGAVWETGGNQWNEAATFGKSDEALPSLLLHSCCAPCSTSVVERLSQRFRITIYFCNSNIDDEAEYKRRLAAQREFIVRYNASGNKSVALNMVLAPYSPAAFLNLVKGLEDAPEGGARCRVCIEDRLSKTAEFAALNGYDFFSTTLSVSRHKNYYMISQLGRILATRYGISFEDGDYKKNGGEQRSIELSKAYDLYRQNYCGCRFSK